MPVPAFPGFSGTGIPQALPGSEHDTGWGWLPTLKSLIPFLRFSSVSAPLLKGTEVMAIVLNQPC